MSEKYTEEEIARVKARVDLGAVIGEFVDLKPRGTSLKGCCPFHDEKTPSFYVHPDKGFYKCFGCGAKGDAIKFLEEYRGFSFPGALSQLAAQYGVELGDDRFADFTHKVRHIMVPMGRILAVPGRDDMRSPSCGVASYSTLTSHSGIELPDNFIPIGSPRIPEINAYLESRGFNLEDMKAKGVGGCRTGSMWGRLVLPCYMDDLLVFWQARLVIPRSPGPDGREAPKYLSSTGVRSEICVYNLNEAVQHPITNIVEGFFDAETSGKDTAATYGCRVTEAQARILKLRGAKRICLCFDPDAWKKVHKSGKERPPPVLTAGRQVLQSGMELLVTILVGGDPNSVGHEKTRAALGKAIQVQNESDLETLVERVGETLL